MVHNRNENLLQYVGQIFTLQNLGFRLGNLFRVSSLNGIHPFNPLVTLGKIMGGGFPIAAYTGRKEITEMVAPAGGVYQAGTFSGNPISVVAGLTTIEYIKSKREIFYEALESKTNVLVEALSDLVAEKKLSFTN
jgi:glutamate-1-semialdehyde 2,1-aminomutase